MAERNVCQKKPSTLQIKKKSGIKSAVKTNKYEARPQVHSAPTPTTKPLDDFLAKEEHYKHLNAEIEAKTAYLERQTELLIKEQNDVLSKPLSNVHLTDFEDNHERKVASLPNKSGQTPCGKTGRATIGATAALGVNIKQQTIHTEKQLKHQTKTTPETSSANYLDPMEEAADTFLAKTIENIENRMDENDSLKAETSFSRDNTGVSDAQIRVLKAKQRIMQEELDQLTSEYYMKEDENIRLNAKVKELEDDRAKLQKAQHILQTQIEKHKALSEESAKKCEGLQLHVAALNKEIENLNRSNKQAAALHSTVEIRLNRAMEESQRLKSEINKMKQMGKDKGNEEHEGKELLLTENKLLKKQKAELIVAFKKQLKLIDILRRQKMHFEAAKLLSFTEEEFVKALDWGGAF